VDRSDVLRALDLAAAGAERVSLVPSAVGRGAVAVAALLRTAARVMRERGDSADEILERVRAPRALSMPWHSGEVVDGELVDTRDGKIKSKRPPER